MNKNKGIRLSLIFFVAIASFFGPLIGKDKPPAEWDTLLTVFVAVILVLPIIIGIQVFSSPMHQTWSKPSWDSDPFDFSEPWHFLHLGAYVLMVQGIVAAIRIYLSHASFYPSVLMPLVLGVALWVGVKISILIHRSNFV